MLFGDGATDPERELKRVLRSTKSGWASIDVDHPAYVAYAGADAALAARLYERLRPDAGHDRLLELEHRVAAIGLRAGLRGITVDAGVAVLLEEQLAAQQDRLEQELDALGIVAIATDAGRSQIVEALEREGLEVSNGRLDKSVLGPLAAAGSRVAREVMALRTITKLRSLYSRMFERALAQDGRLHAYTRSLATVTGRMAISGVPLQTVPKTLELEHNASHALAVRDVLIADYGHVCASVDFSLMELRIAAALSGDSALRDVVASGDAHTAIARALFNTRTPSAKQRGVAKTINFGAMYGMREHTLAQRLSVSHGQARDFLEAWWRRFPQLRAYADAVSDDDRTPWGRRLPVDVPHYARLNHRIQAAGRDVFCGSLLRLEDAGFDDLLLLPLHDEAVVQLPDHKAPEMLAEIADLFAGGLNGVALPVDAHLGGRSWGSAK